MRFVLAALLCLLSLPVSAATIVLSGNVSSSAQKVYTIGSNTVLDLNGHTITCLGNPATSVNFGVYASGVSNVTIKNGSITGCFFGVHAGYSSNVTIQNVDFTGNTYIGLNTGGASGVTVTGSTFAGITGYTQEAYAIGINGAGSNSVIEGNTFSGLYRQPGASPSKVGEGVGVLVSSGSTNVTIRDNTFVNTNEAFTPRSMAIWLPAGMNGATIEGNDITGFGDGIRVGASSPASNVTIAGNSFTLGSAIPDTTAILLSNCAPHLCGGTSCVANDNEVTNYAAPWLAGVTDGGGNVVLP